MIKYFILWVVFCFSSLEAKVYDCFMFNNELDLLEIRFHELYDHVDKFVLVESCYMHSDGREKPFYFEDAKGEQRFAKFLDKVIHVQLEDSLLIKDGWPRENYEREQIMRGLVGCDPEDLILISDADEFIPGSRVREIVRASKFFKVIGFKQRMYRFFLNRVAPYRIGDHVSEHERKQIPWAGTGAVRYKHLTDTFTPQTVRVIVRTEGTKMYDFGWHFSSMGRPEDIMHKYESVVEHQYYMTADTIRGQADYHPLVNIDFTFPLYIQQNIEYFIEKGLIDTSTVCK